MPFARGSVLRKIATPALGFVLETAAYHLVGQGGVELAVEDPDVPRATPEIKLGLEFPGRTDRDAPEDVLVEGFLGGGIASLGRFLLGGRKGL